MSSTTVRDVVRSNNLPAKHAAKLTEMLNEIANQHPSGEIIPGTFGSAGIVPSAQIQAIPKCVMANCTQGDVNLQGDKSWAGSVLGAYPNKIASNDSGGFRHRYVDGSEGALLYHSNNEVSDITYVFAWKDSRGDNKVYVEAGPSENYKIDSFSFSWRTIRNRLHIYGSDKFYFKDNGTGAEASAQIWDGSDFTALAVFDITTTAPPK